MYNGTFQPMKFHLSPTPPESELPDGGASMAFGGYLALPSARTLLLNGNAVNLGARAFDLLILLLASKGTIVSKEAIMQYVWPTTTVDESNLRFQITSLRRALGEERDRIKTITGRGYLFVPDDAQVEAAAGPSERTGHMLDIPCATRKPAIVIIDENPENREALRRLLKPFNADVTSFVSIEAFRNSRSCSGPRGVTRSSKDR
ncbi:winged helix-turn-helix domain-containing protein [Sphingomonas sp. PB4P5]|uniref:winged helix-turn-helix domain-containing protein n=1 Tax=Parasphingomonas puruogangriensis TaxID=3096155 RepID=UPI002FC592E0